LLSECGGDDRVGSNLNELSQHFGVIFRNDVAKDHENFWGKPIYPIIEAFTDHPITKGLDSIVYLHGCTLDCDYPAMGVAFLSEHARPAGAPVLAAASLGKGRVVAVGDSSSFGDWRDLGHDHEHNFVAFERMLRWLGGKGQGIRQVKSASAVSLRSAATHCRMQGKFREAAEGYLEAYEQSLVEGKPKNAAYVLLSASDCYAEVGDVKSSLRLLTLATVVSQRQGWKGALQRIPGVVRKLSQHVERKPSTSARAPDQDLAYRRLLEELLEQKDAPSKGKTLERIAAYALSLVDGFAVTASNSLSQDRSAEIDMRILNRSTDPILAYLGPTILVECKAHSAKVRAPDVRNFAQKLAEKTVKTGIMVALNGITGTPTRADCAHGSVRNARQTGRLVIVLDGRDLYEIVSGLDPTEVILRGFDKIYAL
jgi:hypothetical protein